MKKIRNFAFGFVAIAALFSTPATFAPTQSATAGNAPTVSVVMNLSGGDTGGANVSGISVSDSAGSLGE